MTAPAGRWAQFAIAPALLVAAVFAVYLPYLGNPPMFDDAAFFSGEHFYVLAVKPWEYGVRGLPYFTLAFVQTVFGEIQAHRIASGIFHAGCAWLAFLLVRDLLADVEGGRDAGSATLRATGSALAAALAFAVHPVAVYGAGYLVQRTGVLALLFSLLCLRSLRQGLVIGRPGWILAAALWYALAVFSKEHALLVPAVATAFAVVVGRLRGVAIARGVALFLALCVPVALAILLGRMDFVVAPYEPNLADLQDELHTPQAGGSTLETWFASAAMQAGLFYKYALLWFWPDTRQMAIDLRVDFAAGAGVAWGVVRLALFALAGLVAALVLARGGRRMAAAGFGVLYVWIMYLIEMGAVRFQEPFVLYRSYLWAPGYAILAALALHGLRVRYAAGAAAVVLPLLGIAAQNRLDTFRSQLALWSDAVSALPHAEVGGARRIYYNRGRALYLAGRYEEALRDAEMAVRLAPRNGPMRIARGAALLELGRLQEAARDFEAATQLSAWEPRGHVLLASVLDRLGQPARADEVVQRAEAIGHKGSIEWLEQFRKSRAKASAGPNAR